MQKLLFNPYFLYFVCVLLLAVIIFQQICFFKKLRTIRKDTLKRSKAVRGGQTAEQFVPFMEDFPGNAADAKFLGKPVDFIVFDGLDAKDEVDEILFVEVKTGTSRLSEREKSIRRAIENQKVRYVEYRI